MEDTLKVPQPQNSRPPLAPSRKFMSRQCIHRRTVLLCVSGILSCLSMDTKDRASPTGVLLHISSSCNCRSYQCDNDLHAGSQSAAAAHTQGLHNRPMSAALMSMMKVHWHQKKTMAVACHVITLGRPRLSLSLSFGTTVRNLEKRTCAAPIMSHPCPVLRRSLLWNGCFSFGTPSRVVGVAIRPRAFPPCVAWLDGVTLWPARCSC